jgi:hypothetical protein
LLTSQSGVTEQKNKAKLIQPFSFAHKGQSYCWLTPFKTIFSTRCALLKSEITLIVFSVLMIWLLNQLSNHFGIDKHFGADIGIHW